MPGFEASTGDGLQLFEVFSKPLPALRLNSSLQRTCQAGFTLQFCASYIWSLLLSHLCETSGRIHFFFPVSNADAE